MTKKPLLITMGDPAGIGPEIIIQAVAEGAFADLQHPVLVVGDAAVLERAAGVCGQRGTWQAQPGSGPAARILDLAGHALPLVEGSRLDIQQQAYGQPQAETGAAMAAYITWACDRCLAGEAAGMVTAPINKQALHLAGIDSPGHTELLAARCGVDNVVMMLAGKRLKVCLVTTHCALREVPQRLNRDIILATLRITADSLQRQFNLPAPRLAVLALNPHAGEGGLFGDEERQHILPAITTARTEGIDAVGPLSADSVFHFALGGEYDAVVCMYHDQGLIPLKLLHFSDAVNVTLGLPIVRTSVDHGTAYDLAGTGRANPASLIAAVRMADEMAAKTHR
jgi:4-hydroxythreonine-4-phosphate dehydrogenase